MLYWVLRPWRQTFDFSGRATRREYWLFIVQLYLALVLAVIGLGAVAGAAGAGTGERGAAGIGLGVILLFLVAFIPYLSASVRRLHDHDKSGWLFLLSMVPLVGWIFYLIMMLTPGTPGENGYGPDPRDPLGSAEDMAGVFS
jgi:uncharacterized membrane protein YhaH (DUF805 family)